MQNKPADKSSKKTWSPRDADDLDKRLAALGEAQTKAAERGGAHVKVVEKSWTKEAKKGN